MSFRKRGIAFAMHGGNFANGVPQADPEQREDIEVQTLWYRAPEIVFGSRRWGTPIDLFSLGLVLAEMSGEVFHRTTVTGASVVDQDRYGQALIAQFGRPPVTNDHGWRRWAAAADSPAKTWPQQLCHLLGVDGVALLDGLVQMLPERRPTAAKALENLFFHPYAFPLVGGPRLPGTRHQWNLHAGQVEADTLRWLQLDLAHTTLDELGVVWEGRGVNFKTEFEKKFILAGWVGHHPVCKSMCKLSLASPLPLPRVTAWFEAWKLENRDSLRELHSRCRAAAEAAECRDEEDKKNLQAFLAAPLDSWLGNCGELAVTRAEGSWAEKEHTDGGASVVHGGLTLFGRRLLSCWPEGDKDAQPVVELVNGPGTFYLGSLTGPLHRVQHLPAAPGDLWHEEYSVTVMLRTALFAWNRAREKNTTPAPVAFFFAMAETVTECFATLPWKLPSLEAAKAVADKRKPTASSPASPQVGQKQKADSTTGPQKKRKQ
jgi:hypothetical protein